MNHTNHSSSPSDSDLDSPSTTPVGEEAEFYFAKKNTIRELISLYEQKFKNQDSFKLSPSVIRRLNTVKNGDGETNSENIEVINEDFKNVIVEKRKVKAELSRTLTELRKKYVTCACSTIRTKDKKPSGENSHLFECCLLVELNVSNLTPYVKGKYPFEYEVPQWVEHLCYPDATEWSPELSLEQTNQTYQCYSLVITNEKGERKFGYCRRVVPEDSSLCLPLTYCILSSYRATGFYHKVLQELESRHGLPQVLQNAFLRELYNSKFPEPGESVKLTCLSRILATDNSLMENGKKKRQAISITDTNINNKIFDDIEKSWVIVDSKVLREKSKNVYGALNKVKNVNDFEVVNNFSADHEKSEASERESVLNESYLHKRNCVANYSNIQISNALVNDEKVKNHLKISTTESVLNSCTALMNLSIHDCLLGDVILRRPYDHRIEEIDLTVLFETLDLNVLLQTFGSLLLERKVIFISKCLSKLSSCVEALQSILYPFSWQHTYIPVLPHNMLGILEAPTPLVAGILTSNIDRQLEDVEDGLVINLDTSTVVCSVGDERGIIPKKLRTALILALQMVTPSSSANGSRNVLVSEAFIRMFVEACGHYNHYIIDNTAGEKIFDKEGFKNHHSSKSLHMFLDWFSETTMFQFFIQLRIEEGKQDVAHNIFEQRCLEKDSEKLAQLPKAVMKIKSFFKT